MHKDTANRLAILRDRTSSRQSSETIYGEATNAINPTTGRDYSQEEQRVVLPGEFPFVISLEEKKENESDYFSLNSIILDKDRYFSKNIFPQVVSAPTTEIFELHRALGRMDVKDKKLDRFEYHDFTHQLLSLSEKYFKTPGLTLDSITTTEGMNVALEAQERAYLRPKISFEEYSSLRQNQGLDLNEPFCFFPKKRLSEKHYPNLRIIGGPGDSFQ